MGDALEARLVDATNAEYWRLARETEAGMLKAEAIGAVYDETEEGHALLALIARPWRYRSRRTPTPGGALIRALDRHTARSRNARRRGLRSGFAAFSVVSGPGIFAFANGSTLHYGGDGPVELRGGPNLAEEGAP